MKSYVSHQKLLVYDARGYCVYGLMTSVTHGSTKFLCVENQIIVFLLYPNINFLEVEILGNKISSFPQDQILRPYSCHSQPFYALALLTLYSCGK